MATTKLQEFYILRFALAIVAAYCETRFYRAVVEGISPKIGRYVLLFLACGTGMWIASTGKFWIFRSNINERCSNDDLTIN